MPHNAMYHTQGWEEQVDAAVTHLLRTTLSKSSKEQAVPPNSSLEMPAECQKLKKHIALLCDRICKGYMPSGQKIEVNTRLCTFLAIPHSQNVCVKADTYDYTNNHWVTVVCIQNML